ncbi:MAG: hypothetical protein IT258_21195 [Saprospiraceae bacterium]|nr:hypothetical protein [Saprospiraceae bacterium]
MGWFWWVVDFEQANISLVKENAGFSWTSTAVIKVANFQERLFVRGIVERTADVSALTLQPYIFAKES